MAHRITITLAALLVLASTGPAAAGNKALLIGIGDFEDPRINDLSGIDLDMELMTEAAGIMGIRDVKVLFDREATYAAVKAALAGWARAGVGKTDTVLVYISTHGTRVKDTNGDEAEGLDEALVMRDTKVGPKLTNLLIDDELRALLEGNPSQDLRVVIDACHSGTATKSWGGSVAGFAEPLTAQPKVLTYKGMPTGKPKPMLPVESVVGWVALGASRDDQTSQATPQGSAMTLGFHAALVAAARQSQSFSWSQARASAEAWISQRLAGSPYMHHPQLTGNTGLFGRSLVANRNPSHNRERLAALASGIKHALKVTTTKTQYALGEALELVIDAPADGHLVVVNIGTDDQPIILFPSAFEPNGAVRKGPLTIPGSGATYKLEAQRPTGEVVVMALWSKVPLQVFEQGGVEGTGAGKSPFRTVTAAAVRAMRKAFAAVAKDPGKRSALLELEIIE